MTYNKFGSQIGRAIQLLTSREAMWGNRIGMCGCRSDCLTYSFRSSRTPPTRTKAAEKSTSGIGILSVRTGVISRSDVPAGSRSAEHDECAHCATLAPVHRSSYRARGSSCSSRVGLSAKAHPSRVAVRTVRSSTMWMDSTRLAGLRRHRCIGGDRNARGRASRQSSRHVSDLRRLTRRTVSAGGNLAPSHPVRHSP